MTNPRSNPHVRNPDVEALRRHHQINYFNLLSQLGCDPDNTLSARTHWGSPEVGAGTERLTTVLHKGIPDTHPSSSVVARGALVAFAASVLGVSAIPANPLSNTNIGVLRRELELALMGETTPDALRDSSAMTAARRLRPDLFAKDSSWSPKGSHDHSIEIQERLSRASEDRGIGGCVPTPS